MPAERTPPATAAPASGPRARPWVWAAALVPAAVLALVVAAFHLPSGLRATVVELSGPWRVHPGDDPAYGAFDCADAAWATFEVPGSFASAHVPEPDAWLRKEVELPSTLADQDLFLMLGNPRGGLAQVFVNGHAVAEYGIFSARLRLDIDTGAGWVVPREYWRQGRNVIALHFWWKGSYSGLASSENYIGPTATLGRHFAVTRMVESALRHGPPFTFVFVVLLMVALMFLEGSGGDRFRYASIVGLTLSAGFYVTGLTGTGPWLWVPFTDRFHAAYFGPILISASFLEFLEHYAIGRVTGFRRANRALTALFVVAGLVSSHRFELFVAFTAVLALAMIYMIVLVVHVVRDQKHPWSPLLAAGVGTTIATAVVDLAGNLDIVSAPRLFVLGLSNVPILASVVVVADFLAISTLNKALSRSLGSANAELGVALAAAQEAVRVKGEFLASVSHELRTPLNPIINIPEGLLEQLVWVPAARCGACGEVFTTEGEGALPADLACPACGAPELARDVVRQFLGTPDELATLLATVQRSGRALLGVVDQMLDMSTLEAGNMALRRSDVRLHGVVSLSLAAAQPWAAAAGVELVCDAIPLHWTVHVDEAKLAQVFAGLLSNAIRFSTAGQRVNVRAAAEGSGFCVDVIDHGIGIAPEHHSAVFESFRQVEAQNTRKQGGAGLGLAIAKGIVKLHSGTIRLTSTLGAGATFTVWLPSAAAGTEAAVSSSTPDRHAATSAQ